MTRENLLKELRSETYIRLQPSLLHGIGVFAIRPIPQGCRNMFSSGLGEWIPISKEEVALLPKGSRDLVETYCLWDNDHYFVPDYGFKMMDLVNYLNHSDSPNIVSIDDGNFFEAIRDILPGDELLVDYGTLTEQ